MRIVHIIPTYNEKENIGKMIERLESLRFKAKKWDTMILVVDDKSPDGTEEIVKALQKKYKNISIITKEKEGLGKALIKGYDFAIKNLHADVVIPNDADFQWNPEDYIKLVEKIEEGYDVAVASRHVKGGRVVGWNWFRKLNHDISNYLLAWWVAGVHEVKDHAGNFKAIKVRNVLDRVKLQGMRNAGFSFQLHILYELSKVGAKFIEVPVTFKEREFGTSKIGFNKYYVRDIVEYIRSAILIRYDRSKRFMTFCVVGGVGFIIQTVLSKILITNTVSPALAVTVGAEAAILSNFTLNNLWTFAHKKITGMKLFQELFRFNMISIGAIFIQGFAVAIGTKYFGKESWFLCMVFSIVFIIIPYSYFLYNRVIWKTHKK